MNETPELNLLPRLLSILDEIHRVPSLFPALRGLIDKGRRAGRKTSQFLILGSASIDLLKQSGESLAGRISYLDLGPLCVSEVDDIDLVLHWTNGTTWAIEIKRSIKPTASRGFHEACEDIQASKRFIVYFGDNEFRLANGVTAISVSRLMTLLAS